MRPHNRIGKMVGFRLVTLLLLLILIISPVRTVSAHTSVFIAPGDPGGTCAQDSPCSLSTGLSEIDEGGTLYAKAGTYQVDVGSELVSLTKTIYFYGGWDGSPTGTPNRDPTTHESILDGENVRRVLYINGISTLQPVIDGWTITGGNANNLTADCPAYTVTAGCGGGIFVHGAEPTISHNIIEYNHAAISSVSENDTKTGWGGGILIEGSQGTTIQENTIQYNDAHVNGRGWGAGICLDNSGGSTIVQDNEIFMNEDSSSPNPADFFPHAGSGIVIYNNYGQIQVYGNTIHSNNPSGHTYWGTAVTTQYVDDSVLIVGNTILDNYGMSAIGLAYSIPTIRQNVIINPDADDGVSFSGHYSDPLQYARVENNIIAKHKISNIHVNADPGNIARAVLIHNTLVGSGYGLWVETDTNVIFDRGIISDANTTGIQVADGPTVTLTASNTLFFNNVINGETGINPIFGKPLYVDPAGNDYHIGYSSAAINCVTDGGIATDIDGESRPIGSGSTPFDVGADEFWDIYWWRDFLPAIFRW